MLLKHDFLILWGQFVGLILKKMNFCFPSSVLIWTKDFYRYLCKFGLQIHKDIYNIMRIVCYFIKNASCFYYYIHHSFPFALNTNLGFLKFESQFDGAKREKLHNIKNIIVNEVKYFLQ